MSGQKFSEPLYPSRVIHNARINGLSVEDYVNSQPPELRDEFIADIQNHRQRQAKSDLEGLRSSYRTPFSDPSEIPLFPDRDSDRYNAGSYAAIADQGPTIEELEAGSQSPVLSTPSEPQDPLLTQPTFISIAQSQNKTPQEYLDSLSPRMLENSRKILLGVEPELQLQPAAQSPVLQSLEAGPRMDTGSTVATTPAPVLTPRVPGEGVIAAPVANPADAPTSYADMSPQDFQRMAQNPADVPAGAEFPGLGADFSGIERFDSAMEQRTQAAREGIDQGVLQQQAASGDARALAELERRKNTVQNAGVLPTAANEPIPMEQAAAERANAALAATEGNRPVLINTTTPTTTPTTANTTAPQSPVLGGSGTSSSRSPALSRGAGNMTANARGSALGMVPRGESLIRIGGAMYSGALQGDGLGAAAREYGSIQDANRAAEVAAAKQAEATRLAELRARGTGAGKDKGKREGAYGSFADQASKMNSVMERLRIDRNVTGPFAGTAQALFDRTGFGDADRANLRLAMEDIAVSEQLMYTERTKGAITDREMAMFRRPIPKITDDEAVWLAWLEPRAAVLNQLAQNGISDAAAGKSSSTAAPSNDSLSDEDLSYIN